jgi:plasmid stabilization system protein ParE
MQVFWTENALENTLFIQLYLANNFPKKVSENFIYLLHTFESVVSSFPNLYSQSGYLGIRRAVLNKYISVFYVHAELQISVLAVFDVAISPTGFKLMYVI